MGKLETAIATGMVALSLSACASGGAKEAPQIVEVQQPTFWGKTEAAYARCISIPSSVQLSEADIRYVVECIKAYFESS